MRFPAGKSLKCPDCSSTFLIEKKEQSTLPSQTQPSVVPKQSEPVPLDKSNSHSSIGKIFHALLITHLFLVTFWFLNKRRIYMVLLPANTFA